MPIIHKRSLTPGSVPTTASLAVGQLAINVPDGRIFLRKSGSTDTIESAITTNAPNSGSVSLTGSLSISGSGTVLSLAGDILEIDSDSAEITGSFIVSGSTTLIGPVNITGSVIATSFSGSYSGSGANLFGIPASGIVGLNLAQIATGSVTASVSLSQFTVISGSSTEFVVTGTGVTLGSIVTDTHRVTGSLNVTGSVAISNNITASVALISGSGTQRLTVIGSGSAQPLFTVQGSQGELFSIVDSLSGSLFSVNDASGLPIMEVFSDNTTLIGNYLAPALHTTVRTTTTNSGSFTIYAVPTASYDGIFMDYTAKSGSAARAGQFMAIWSGSLVNFTDNSTTDFGNTSRLMFTGSISGSNMVVTGNVTTGSGWTIKAIIRSI